MGAARLTMVDRDSSTGYLLAGAAGGTAAVGSLCIKLMGDTTLSAYLCPIWDDCEPHLRLLCYVGRIASLGGYLAANAIMWTLFVQALQRLPSVHAAVVNSSANVCFSAVFAFVLFREPLPPMWWVGVSFIIMGICLVVTESDTTSPTPKTNGIQPTASPSSSTTAPSSLTAHG